jgi:hypothetical protein
MTLEPSVIAFASAAGAKQWVYSIPTGTARTYRLQARLTFGVSQVITAESRLITAVYLPFGSTGGSSLGGTLGTPEMPAATGEGG